MTKAEADIRRDQNQKIAKWLKGLENARRRIARETHDPKERAMLEARQGVYEGIADDILGGAPDRAV